MNLDLTKCHDFIEQMPAPLNYSTIVNLIHFSELRNLVNRSGLTGSFIKSRLGCTVIAKRGKMALKNQ